MSNKKEIRLTHSYIACFPFMRLFKIGVGGAGRKIITEIAYNDVSVLIAFVAIKTSAKNASTTKQTSNLEK